MFSFADLPVKTGSLLLLFAWCTIWCFFDLTRPQTRQQRVSNALHLLMAVVMLLMVTPATWRPLVSVVPIGWLVAGFAVATGWFGAQSWRAHRRGDRAGARHFAGHTAMFAAMTWHLAAMAAKASAMGPMHSGSSGGASPAGHAAAPGSLMWVLALIGLPLMAYLLVAGLASLWQAVAPTPRNRPTSTGPEHASGAHTCGVARPVGSPQFRLAALASFAMNFGMFWMSTGLLLPILPMMSVFSI